MNIDYRIHESRSIFYSTLLFYNTTAIFAMFYLFLAMVFLSVMKYSMFSMNHSKKAPANYRNRFINPVIQSRRMQ